MAHIPVEKKFYQKIKVKGQLPPTLNQYSKECQKQHMPKKVKVLAKEYLVKAIEISLKKGGGISKNEEILKLCEEVDIAKLNSRNFCCISHRWCSTQVPIDKFMDTFVKFLETGYICSEDTCFEEKVHFETASNWWVFMSKVVPWVFGGENAKESDMTKFLTYLAKRTTLLGLSTDSKKDNEFHLGPDEIDSLDEQLMGLHVGLTVLQMDYTVLHEHFTPNTMLESIKKWLILAIPLKAIPKLTKSNCDQAVKFAQSQKVHFNHSDPEKLLSQVVDLVEKTLENLRSKKLKESVLVKRYQECLECCEQIKNIENSSNSFNGHDPIALLTLMMMRKSSFDYFWVDVFCTPQRKDDIDETLKAVKDGMAVFSLATVIICPSFAVEKLLSYSGMSLATAINQSKIDSKDLEYVKKFPILTFNEKCFLFADESYFSRMWTFHEMGIGDTLFYWWQYMLGPFAKTSPNKLVFKIDTTSKNNYRAGLNQSSFDSGSNRSEAISILRQSGPGDGMQTMFGSNFSTMQSGFALDWEMLARSIFKLDKDRDVSEQILHKKVTFFQSYLLQYSPHNCPQYSYAWVKNPERVNHCFKYDKDYNLLAGCVENPSQYNPKPMKLKVANKTAKLGDETILTDCKVYKIAELTQENFFEAYAQHTLYYMIGQRKTDLDKTPSSGYIIIGDWKLPDALAKTREEALKVLKQYHMPKNLTKEMKKSYQMPFDYFVPVQKVMIVKSENKNNDFTIVYGVTPYQIMMLNANRADLEKTKNNKEINSVELVMN